MPGLRVYLPYRPVPVRVRLGYGTELSRLEAAVLRGIVRLWAKRSNHGEMAVGVGLNTLDMRFNLGPRIMLDLVFDLWRREYVTLDLYRAEVAPLPHVVAAAADPDKLARLGGGEFKLDTVEVWFDRVSGHLTGRSGFTHPPDRQLIVPPDPLFNAVVTDVRGGEVVRAVEELLDENTPRRERTTDDGDPAPPKGRPLRVMESRLAPSQLVSPTHRTSWFPVDIAVREDPDSQDVRVTATPTSWRSAAQDDRIGRLLTQFVHTRPDHPFSTRLRGSVEVRLTAPPTLGRSQARLEKLAESAQTAAAGTRRTLHSQLTEVLLATRNQVETRVNGEVRADLVRENEAYRDRVRMVIGQARRQVVLASSAVHYEGVSDLLPELHDAVGRGVQVVVVWANQHSGVLDDRTRNAFTELRMRANDRSSGNATVVVARKPSNFHASVVIADNHAALVGGYSFLGRLERGVDQFGAFVRAPEPGGCEAVDSLLRWVRNTVSDGTTSSAILFRERDFPGHDPALSPPGKRIRWSPLPEPLQQDVSASDAAVRAWAMAWRRCVAEVGKVLGGRALPSVALVEDTAHRDALWDMIRAAEEQIVIAGESISARVVSPQFVRAVRERLGAGVRVEVFHRHVEKGSEPTRQLLVDVAKESSRSFRLHRLQSTACVLVRDDDEVVVGGFDFLSHSGFYRTQPGRRPAAELSLRITGGDVAARACEDLGVPPVHRRRQSGTGVPLSLDHQGNRLLVALDSCDDPMQRGKLISDAVETGDGPSLLDELSEVGAADDVLRVAAAAALRGRLRTADPASVRWLNWLVADLWSQHRFMEAWVLRRAVPTGTPSLSLTAAAAFAGTPWVVSALHSAALEDDLPPAATAAVIAFTASQVLVWPAALGPIPPEVAFELREVLRVLEDAPVAACWTELAATVAGSPPGVDDPGVGAIARAEHARTTRQARLAEAWERADTALTNATRMTFVFDVGLRTHGHLFHPNGVFGQFADVVARQDLPAARRWAARPDLDDMGTFLDNVSNEVMGSSKKLIHSGKRKVYLERLTAVRTAAQEIAEFTDADGDTPPSHQAAKARPLAVRLAELSAKLRADLADQAGAERYLAEQALDSMQDIVEWGLR